MESDKLLTQAASKADAKDFQNAVKLLSMSIEYNPKNRVAYYIRASINFEQGKLADALLDINSAISISPGISSHYVLRGRIFDLLGKQDVSYSDYSKALDLDHKNVDAYELRSALACLSRHYDDSISDASAAIRLDPSRYAGYYWRSACLFSKGELGPSKQDIELSIARNPQFSRSHSLYSMILIRLEKFKAAIDAVNYGLTKSAPIAEHYNARAVAKLAIQDLDGAIIDTKSALELEPDNKIALDNLGALLKMQSK